MAVSVILEDLTITNGNINKWTNYKRHKSMLTDHVHQHFIKKLQVAHSIKDTTIYTIYKTNNILVFSGTGHRVVKISRCGKLGE